MTPKKLLLHVCCGPCATHCIKVLEAEYQTALFFSNSNIAPKQEYQRRLAAAQILARECRLPLVQDTYDHDAWLEHIRGLEREPEGGARCEKCFEFSLQRTARYAKQHGFDVFTTSLTISPHKDSQLIFRVGGKLGSLLCTDFKKRDGFRHSVELSKAYKLYRQNTCGCEFSPP